MKTKKEPAPRTGSRPSPNTTAAESTVHRPEDGYSAPSPADRREAALLAELRELGYTVAVRCQVCSHVLTHPASVARFIGPKCAAKAVV